MIRDRSEFSMRIVDGNEPIATAARALISRSFQSRLDAFPRMNHRHYLVVEVGGRNSGVLAACSSISLGREQTLFSECYLQQPIEAVISNRLGTGIRRSEICEIGSLSTDPSFIPSVKRVVAYFPWFAAHVGCKFALVTVTSYMRLAFISSGTNFTPICHADPSCLPREERTRWGRYYDFDPQTGFIDIEHLSFLNQFSRSSEHPDEVIIQLPGARRAEVCS